jgi:hypothetical protein
MLAQLLSEYKLSYQILNAKPENVRENQKLLHKLEQKEVLQLLQIWQAEEQILF